VASRTAALNARKAGNNDEANKIVDTRMVPAIADYVGTLNKMVAYQKRAIESSGEQVIVSTRSGRTVYIFAMFISLALGVALMWWLRRAIVDPLGKAVNVAETVASGDLTATIDTRSDDEAGQLMRALDVMNKSLANIVREVRNGTENITVASREIAMSNSDLSSRTEQQASSLEETASAIEELTSTVKANAESARQAAKFVEGATNVAAKGGRMVDEVVHTMSDISESSKKISAIIGVIDGIAFQTNILALNAAVEAARAGDEGRGFAVVAAEVRTLALRSAAAAKEIKTLIGESGDRVEVGARLVGEAGKTMQEIVESVTSANDIISQIALSSREQSAGIEQVNQAIMHMEEATHQNAALVEEAAATAEHLAAQAEELEKAIASFKVNEASDIVADGSGADGHSSTMRSAPSQARKARTQAALVLRRNRTPPVRALRKNDNNEEWTEL
jgi:methyl-accepting chemotaxis protein